MSILITQFELCLRCAFDCSTARMRQQFKSGRNR